jgi:hypothetical protein
MGNHPISTSTSEDQVSPSTLNDDSTDEKAIVPTWLATPSILEQSSIEQASEARVSADPVISDPITNNAVLSSTATTQIFNPTLIMPIVTQIAIPTSSQNHPPLFAEPLPVKLLTTVFNTDISFATTTGSYTPLQLTSRLKDSVYGELIVSEKRHSLTNANAHSHALHSLVNEYQFDSLLDRADFVSTHFRMQNTLVKKAVDEFHADLVGVID